MVNDTWTVYWEEFMSDSYGYGSEVEFNKDKSVRYSNRLTGLERRCFIPRLTWSAIW